MLYFVEGFTSLGAGKVGEAGLSHAFPAGSSFGSVQVMPGPAGLSGVVVAPDGERAAYCAEEQEWREISPAFGKRRWCGWWNDSPPTPPSLQRAGQLPGKSVRMADGAEWLVPRAYEIDEGGIRPMLPAAMRRLPSGGWTRGDALPAYRELWAVAERIAESFPASYRYDDVAIVLGGNYRIGPDEVGALGLLDSAGECAAQVVSVFLDLEGLEAIQKKTAIPGGLPT